MAKPTHEPAAQRGIPKSTAGTPPPGQRPRDDDHEHQAVPSDLTLRVKALESLLVEKGLVDREALDALVDTYETQDRSAQRRARRRAGLGRSAVQDSA